MEYKTVKGLYSEDRTAGNKYREEQLQQLAKFIAAQREKADDERVRYFTPDISSVHAFNASTVAYRAEFVKMLGWPLTIYSKDLPVPDAVTEFVCEDDLGKIYRLHIPVLPGLDMYGILFLPKGSGPFPLIISQHGGAGTPELCSGFFDSGNYHDMSRRMLRRGFAVFAPQLYIWGEEFGTKPDHIHMDVQLKQLGGSIAALEIFRIKRSIDYLSARPDIDSSRIGMAGLSYGGFYTLFSAASDLRIKAALSSCFFNNRFIYDWHDWIWFNSANTFLDAEVCGLICPRPLYIEVGKADELFDVRYVEKEYRKVEAIYKRLGIPDNLGYREIEGGHEFGKDDRGIDFLCGKLKDTIINMEY